MVAVLLQQSRDIDRVRAAVSGLIGHEALGLAEGLGRVVITTFPDLTQPGHFSAATGGLASIAGEPLFRDKIARQRAARSRAMAAVGDLDRGTILASAGAPGWQMVLPDPRIAGGWTLLPFDLNGFGEPIAYESAEQAMEDARAHGYGERDDGALDRIKDAPSFQRGLFGADVARRLLEGGISEEEACDLMAEHERSLRTLHSISTAGAQAFTLDGGRSIMLLADRIVPGEEKAVFLHEIVHRHARSLLAAGVWDGLLNRVRSWHAREIDSIERRVHDSSLARALDADASQGPLFEEEWLAYAVEEAVLAGVIPSVEGREDSAECWLDGVVSALRGVIHHVTGSPSPDLTPQMLVDMAYAMAQLDSPQRVSRILGCLTPEEREHLREVMGPLATDAAVSDPIAPSGPKVQLKGAIAEWMSSSVATTDGKPGGHPLVVFHGTRANFLRFRPSAMGNLGRGIYFASKKEQAGEYGDRVIQTVLKLENPWVVDLEYDTPAALAAEFDSPSVDAVLSLPGGRALMEQARAGDGMYGPELQALLQARGHDGVIGRYQDGSTEFVVFSPDQVLRLDLAISQQVLNNSVPAAVVYHWTDVDFDRFDIGMGQLGAHFGSLDAARDRARGRDRIGYEVEEDEGDFFVVPDAGPARDEWLGPFPTRALALEFVSKQPQLIDPLAARLDIQHPVRLPDLGGWSAWSVIQALPDGTLTADEIERVMSSDDRDASLRGVLIEKGIDGVVYTNEVEDPGSESFIVFSADQIKLYGRSADVKFSATKKQDQTETPAFRKWFGDSMVVDEHGFPLVVYHGSPDLRFLNEDGVFRSQKGRIGFGRADAAHWFTPSEATAKSYADPLRAVDYQNAEEGVVAAYIKLEHPLVIEGGGQNWRDAQKRGKTSSVIDEARKGGHDGVIIRNVKDDYNNDNKTRPTDTYVVFASTQIKSAIGNRGTFDGDNPDIRFSKRDQTRTPEFENWFGASKVVDASGKPHVMYHGTANGKVEFAEKTWAFFSSSPMVASSYTSGRVYVSPKDRGKAVYPVFLKSERPLVVDGTGQYWAQITANVEGFEGAYSTEDLAQFARRNGYDGLIIKNIIDPGPAARSFPKTDARRAELTGDIVVVFDAKQIKSAVGNSGAFSPADPDIRFSKRESMKTPGFEQWFGGSKVVDPQGKPLVVYHGTIVRPMRDGEPDMGDVAAFDRMFTTRFRKPSVDTVGSWFTTNPGVDGAEMYAGGGRAPGAVIYPVLLSIKNPQVTTFQLMTRRARLLHNGQDDGRMIGAPEVEAYRAWLKAMGKDGIKIEGSGNENSTEFESQVAWIALEPEQIKSAIGNNGEFSSHDADIRFSTPVADRTKQTESPEFKNWFGASQVVDDQSRPQVLYHGTGKGGFSVFDRGSWKTAYGHFFTPDRSAADFYNHGALSQTYEVFLRAENPLRLDRIVEGEQGLSQWLKGWVAETFEEANGDPLEQFYDWIGGADLYSLGMGKVQDDLIAVAEDNGHDAVAFYDAKGGGGVALSWVAFEASQIKSATDNNGQFSPSDLDIRFSKRALTKTPEFKKWFGDSTVVDADGKPLVVYHGTGGDFSTFDRSRTGQNFVASTLGFYFTNAAKPHFEKGFGLGSTASEYAANAGGTPTVMPVYLSIKNPLVLDDAGGWGGAAMAVDKRQSDIARWAKAGDHDGVVVFDKTGEDLERIFIAFKPEQIKSAIGNSGDFNPSNPDIRMSMAAGALTPSTEGIALPRCSAGAPVSPAMDAGWFIKEFTAPKGVDLRLAPLAPDRHAAQYFDHDGPEVWVEWIEAYEKGAGARAMRQLIEAADRTNTLLRLSVDGDDGGGLYRFYEQFGFEQDPAGGEIMERLPRRDDSLAALSRENTSRTSQSREDRRAAAMAGTTVATRSGKPKVVYHRTAADITEFDVSRGDLGTHFGSKEQAARLHEAHLRDGENTMPVYLNIRNPVRLLDKGSFHADAVAPQLQRKGLIDKLSARRLFLAGDRGTVDERRQANAEIRALLLQAGFDGVVYANKREGPGDSWIAFDPCQIKSAIGNCGGFDFSNPDVRASMPRMRV